MMETEAKGFGSLRKRRQFAGMRASRQSVSRHRLEHPDRRGPGLACADRDQQTIHLRHEQGSARAR
jgi:hypothetical protein